MPTSFTHPTQSFSRVGQSIQFEPCEHMCFHTKRGHSLQNQTISHWSGLQICDC